MTVDCWAFPAVMFERRLVTQRLAALGCDEIGSRAYQLPSTHPAISWSLHLRLLGTYRWELDGGLQWTHAAALPFSRQCLANFGGASWNRCLQNQEVMKTGGGVPLANFSDWGDKRALEIRHLSAEQTAEKIAAIVSNAVLPFVRSICDDKAFLNALCSDTTPMQWLYSQPLTRFAEAAYLVGKLNIPPGELSARLAENRLFMENQLDGISVEAYVNNVLEAAHAA